MLVLPPDRLPPGLLDGLAVVFAMAWAVHRAPARGLPSATAFSAALAAAVGGLLGGHALFAAAHGASGPLDWITLWGSQSSLGVMAGAALGAGVWLRAGGRPVLAYADVAAPGAALGYALARVGCFLHGDDFGVVTGHWGVAYAPGTDVWLAHAARGWIGPDAAASLPVVPVQLLLALAGVVVFATLHRSRLRSGATVGAAALSYGLIRCLFEPLRDDFSAALGPLSVSQALALGLAAMGAALLTVAYGRRSDVAALGAPGIVAGSRPVP